MKVEQIDALEAAGWQIVPKMPTQSMLEAYYDAVGGSLGLNGWEAMLAAAPKVTP